MHTLKYLINFNKAQKADSWDHGGTNTGNNYFTIQVIKLYSWPRVLSLFVIGQGLPVQYISMLEKKEK